MTPSWLSLRDLEYVLAVEKHRHFGRAAKACHVSQPSLSAQIKKIEGYLGTPLFERNNRRVVTTEAGIRLAAQAKLILAEAAKIADLADPAQEAAPETLHIGVIATLSPLVPYFLPNLKKKFPRTALVLREGLTDDLLAELRRGQLDAVLLADTFSKRGLKVFPLFFEPFVLAAPKGHPLLERKNFRPADLKTSEMVLLEDGHCLRDQAVNICPVNRRGQIRRFHATSVETLLHLIACDLGYTLLPAVAAKGQPLSELVGYRAFENPVGRKVVLACRERAGDKKCLVQMAEVVRESAPSMHV